MASSSRSRTSRSSLHRCSSRKRKRGVHIELNPNGPINIFNCVKKRFVKLKKCPIVRHIFCKKEKVEKQVQTITNIQEREDVVEGTKSGSLKSILKQPETVRKKPKKKPGDVKKMKSESSIMANREVSNKSRVSSDTNIAHKTETPFGNAKIDVKKKEVVEATRPPTLTNNSENQRGVDLSLIKNYFENVQNLAKRDFSHGDCLPSQLPEELKFLLCPFGMGNIDTKSKKITTTNLTNITQMRPQCSEAPKKEDDKVSSSSSSKSCKKCKKNKCFKDRVKRRTKTKPHPTKKKSFYSSYESSDDSDQDYKKRKNEQADKNRLTEIVRRKNKLKKVAENGPEKCNKIVVTRNKKGVKNVELELIEECAAASKTSMKIFTSTKNLRNNNFKIGGNGTLYCFSESTEKGNNDNIPPDDEDDSGSSSNKKKTPKERFPSFLTGSQQKNIDTMHQKHQIERGENFSGMDLLQIEGLERLETKPEEEEEEQVEVEEANNTHTVTLVPEDVQTVQSVDETVEPENKEPEQTSEDRNSISLSKKSSIPTLFGVLDDIADKTESNHTGKTLTYRSSAPNVRSSGKEDNKSCCIKCPEKKEEISIKAPPKNSAIEETIIQVIDPQRKSSPPPKEGAPEISEPAALGDSTDGSMRKRQSAIRFSGIDLEPPNVQEEETKSVVEPSEVVNAPTSTPITGATESHLDYRSLEESLNKLASAQNNASPVSSASSYETDRVNNTKAKSTKKISESLIGQRDSLEDVPGQNSSDPYSDGLGSDQKNACTQTPNANAVFLFPTASNSTNSSKPGEYLVTIEKMPQGSNAKRAKIKEILASPSDNTASSTVNPQNTPQVEGKPMEKKLPSENPKECKKKCTCKKCKLKQMGNIPQSTRKPRGQGEGVPKNVDLNCCDQQINNPDCPYRKKEDQQVEGPSETPKGPCGTCDIGTATCTTCTEPSPKGRNSNDDSQYPTGNSFPLVEKVEVHDMKRETDSTDRPQEYQNRPEEEGKTSRNPNNREGSRANGGNEESLPRSNVYYGTHFTPTQKIESLTQTSMIPYLFKDILYKDKPVKDIKNKNYPRPINLETLKKKLSTSIQDSIEKNIKDAFKKPIPVTYKVIKETETQTPNPTAKRRLIPTDNLVSYLSNLRPCSPKKMAATEEKLHLPNMMKCPEDLNRRTNKSHKSEGTSTTAKIKEVRNVLVKNEERNRLVAKTSRIPVFNQAREPRKAVYSEDLSHPPKNNNRFKVLTVVSKGVQKSMDQSTSDQPEYISSRTYARDMKNSTSPVMNQSKQTDNPVEKTWNSGQGDQNVETWFHNKTDNSKASRKFQKRRCKSSQLKTQVKKSKSWPEMKQKTTMNTICYKQQRKIKKLQYDRINTTTNENKNKAIIVRTNKMKEEPMQIIPFKYTNILNSHIWNITFNNNFSCFFHQQLLFHTKFLEQKFSKNILPIVQSKVLALKDKEDSNQSVQSGIEDYSNTNVNRKAKRNSVKPSYSRTVHNPISPFTIRRVLQIWRVNIEEGRMHQIEDLVSIWPGLNKIQAYPVLPSLFSIKGRSNSAVKKKKTRRTKRARTWKSVTALNEEAIGKFELYWKLQSFLRPISSTQDTLDILHPGIATLGKMDSGIPDPNDPEPALKTIRSLEIMRNRPRKISLDKIEDIPEVEELIGEMEMRSKSILSFDKYISVDLSEKPLPDFGNKRLFRYEIFTGAAEGEGLERYCACTPPCPCKEKKKKMKKLKDEYDDTNAFRRFIPKIFRKGYREPGECKYKLAEKAQDEKFVKSLMDDIVQNSLEASERPSKVASTTTYVESSDTEEEHYKFSQLSSNDLDLFGHKKESLPISNDNYSADFPSEIEMSTVFYDEDNNLLEKPTTTKDSTNTFRSFLPKFQPNQPLARSVSKVSQAFETDDRKSFGETSRIFDKKRIQIDSSQILKQKPPKTKQPPPKLPSNIVDSSSKSSQDDVTNQESHIQVADETQGSSNRTYSTGSDVFTVLTDFSSLKSPGLSPIEDRSQELIGSLEDICLKETISGILVCADTSRIILGDMIGKSSKTKLETKKSNRSVNLKVIPRPGSYVHAEVVGESNDRTEIVLTETVPASEDINGLEPLELIVSVDGDSTDASNNIRLLKIPDNVDIKTEMPKQDKSNSSSFSSSGSKKSLSKRKIIEILIERMNDENLKSLDEARSQSSGPQNSMPSIDSLEKIVDEIVGEIAECGKSMTTSASTQMSGDSSSYKNKKSTSSEKTSGGKGKTNNKGSITNLLGKHWLAENIPSIWQTAESPNNPFQYKCTNRRDKQEDKTPEEESTPEKPQTPKKLTAESFLVPYHQYFSFYKQLHKQKSPPNEQEEQPTDSKTSDNNGDQISSNGSGSSRKQPLIVVKVENNSKPDTDKETETESVKKGKNPPKQDHGDTTSTKDTPKCKDLKESIDTYVNEIIKKLQLEGCGKHGDRSTPVEEKTSKETKSKSSQKNEVDKFGDFKRTPESNSHHKKKKSESKTKLDDVEVADMDQERALMIFKENFMKYTEELNKKQLPKTNSKGSKKSSEGSKNNLPKDPKKTIKLSADKSSLISPERSKIMNKTLRHSSLSHKQFLLNMTRDIIKQMENYQDMIVNSIQNSLTQLKKEVSCSAMLTTPDSYRTPVTNTEPRILDDKVCLTKSEDFQLPGGFSILYPNQSQRTAKKVRRTHVCFPIEKLKYALQRQYAELLRERASSSEDEQLRFSCGSRKDRARKSGMSQPYCPYCVLQEDNEEVVESCHSSTVEFNCPREEVLPSDVDLLISKLLDRKLICHSKHCSCD